MTDSITFLRRAASTASVAVAAGALGACHLSDTLAVSDVDVATPTAVSN